MCERRFGCPQASPPKWILTNEFHVLAEFDHINCTLLSGYVITYDVHPIANGQKTDVNMPLRAKTTWSDDAVLASPQGAEVVDTSLLLDELRQKFQRCGQYVEVDFRKLVNWVRVGDQLTHQLHPYPAKLLPNIAHFFTRASIFNHRHGSVLDPFCGSGTVALETSLAGLTPYVADANPFALLITKVKTTPYEPEELQEVTRQILSRAARFRTAPEVPIVNERLWYAPDKKKALEILLRAIVETTDSDQRDFFLVAFSVTARRLSFADPVISVPVRLKVKEQFSETQNRKIMERLAWIGQTNPLVEFARVCNANIERVRESNLALKRRITAVEVGTDARRLRCPRSEGTRPLKAGSIPLIVTSPPYGSAQKYIRSTSLSLNWLGIAGPKGLTALEDDSIGREHIRLRGRDDVNVEELPQAYDRLLLRVQKVNETRAQITRQYLFEMKRALTEMARVTSVGGRIVLVVGNNMVCGEPLRNDEYVAHVLQDLGLKLEIGLIDHIKSRGLMTKRNKTASIISRENVLVFAK